MKELKKTDRIRIFFEKIVHARLEFFVVYNHREAVK